MDRESPPGDALPMSENRLARLETIIHKHRRQFYQSGLALKQIRDEGLYRDVLFDNFAGFLTHPGPQGQGASGVIPSQHPSF